MWLLKKSDVDVLKMPYWQARLLIAERIKDARLNAGLTQKDVAKALHTSQSSYSRMERGELVPDCAQIRTLSGLYQVSVLWLMGYPCFFLDIRPR